MIRPALLALIVWANTSLAQAEVMRLAVTTSFQNSGLADLLLPEIKSDLGLEVRLLVVGTGQALKLGEAGDVDAILVHSRAAEEAFIASGFGTHRREIMYNDFVFVGPSTDPAKIAQARNATDAMRRISVAERTFVSRGDESGTNKKELDLWFQAGLDPRELPDWYKSVGAGMGAALNTATGLNGYILTDRASWLNFGNKSGLALLFAGDPELFNQYAFIPISPTRHAHVRFDLTSHLEAWLTSDRARALIDSYQIDGQNLFTFNAER